MQTLSKKRTLTDASSIGEFPYRTIGETPIEKLIGMKVLPLIASLLSATVASPIAQEKSTLSITVENDSFLGHDSYYTQGLRLQYMHKANELPAWSAAFLTNFPTLGMNVDRMRIGGALGQELFTPARLSQTALVEH